MSVLNTLQCKQCLSILTPLKYNKQFVELICIICRSEEKKSKKKVMVASKVSIKLKTKNTFQYDYFPDFLLCLENA